MNEAACECGHRTSMCHKVNASRWCGAETPNAAYRQAFYDIAEAAGADVSGGIPTWPSIEAWALQAVQQLRADYDEAIGGDAA